MNKIVPFCPNCRTLLLKENQLNKKWEFYNCRKCKFGEAKITGYWLSKDIETDELFYQVAKKLRSELDITIKESINYTEEFYEKFTNKDYCESIGTSLKNEDFFHLEFFNLLFYISYFVVNKMDPNINSFHEWRIKNN